MFDIKQFLSLSYKPICIIVRGGSKNERDTFCEAVERHFESVDADYIYTLNYDKYFLRPDGLLDINKKNQDKAEDFTKNHFNFLTDRKYSVIFSDLGLKVEDFRHFIEKAKEKSYTVKVVRINSKKVKKDIENFSEESIIKEWL